MTQIPSEAPFVTQDHYFCPFCGNEMKGVEQFGEDCSSGENRTLKGHFLLALEGEYQRQELTGHFMKCPGCHFVAFFAEGERE